MTTKERATEESKAPMLARFKSKHLLVEMSYYEGLGYCVSHAGGDGFICGSTSFIPTREQAEEVFLWDVGYPEWRAAADAAYEAAQEKWLASHKTLKDVGVNWLMADGMKEEA